MACSMGRRASSIGVLIVLCLALVSCGANARGGRGGRGRGGGGGRRGVPNVVTGKEFNVLQFGAVPGGRADSTEVIIIIVFFTYTSNSVSGSRNRLI